ncbi:MAG: penicillin acylase family protein [Candidatus Limnocylindrales bacterium]
MRVLKRVGVTVLIVILVAVIGGVGTMAWLTARALPQTSGTLQVPGLDGAVTVGRDEYGIAQIRAGTSHDLFLAQGYTHAQERMWQMEVWRRIGSGRLSELFGESTLETDALIRTLGWRRAAERDLAAVAPPARAVLDAYAEGVNAWLEANRDRLGPAFLISGAAPEPWTPLDTLTWGKVQAWNLGGNLDSELFRYLLDDRLGDPARTDELFAPPPSSPVITPSGLPGSGGAGSGVGFRSNRGASGGGPPEMKARTALMPAQAAGWHDLARSLDVALGLGGLDAGEGLASDHGIGSNNWVVAPSRSVTGGALLANDPHLGISMPSVWYINGLHCTTVTPACPYEVAGVSFPGVPGVVLGHNSRIAWGATNVDPDVQDLVIETIDPADPGRYLGPDGSSRPFVTRSETIGRAGAADFMLSVRETTHGPILNDVDPRLGDAPLMALRWTATREQLGPDRTFEAILGLNTAANFDQFRAALSIYVAPSQNFVYADVEGHIGYQLPGIIPVRSDPADRGDRPVVGRGGRGEWTGTVPFEDLPWQLDPEPGLIVTANNAAVDEAYPAFIGQEWDPGGRAERILDLIEAFGQDGLSVEEMGGIQNDSAPLRARDIVDTLDAAQPSTEDGATVAGRIAAWEGACDEDSLGCAAYMTWEYRVLRDIFDDELGNLARDYVGSAASWSSLAMLLGEPRSRWWDDTTTAGLTETADLIILRAMDEAGAELRAAYGGPENWSWGRLHTATFEEGTLGASGIGPLEWYFNHGPIAVPGVAGAVNNTYHRLSRAYPDPTDPDFEPVGVDRLFAVTNLPSYRLTMDLSDLDGATIVITTGQAGNPFDRHYHDLVDRWRTGQPVPLPFTPGAIDAATVSVLTLAPGGSP